MIHICMMLLLMGVRTLSAEEDFVMVRKTERTSGRVRQQLQDTLAEQLEQYTRALIAELAMTGSLLEKTHKSCSESLRKEMYTTFLVRVESLQRVLVFLQTGVYTQKTVPEDTGSATLSYVIAQDIQAIAAVQEGLLTAMRALLERTVTSCFVAARTKPVLERYIATVKEIRADSEAYAQRMARYREIVEISRDVKE